MQRTVRGFERVGAAMIQLEDQGFPKRCGHLDGKTPLQDARALQQRGFRIAIFPGGTARAVAPTLQGYYASLQQHQSTAPWSGNMLYFDGLNQLIGTPALLARGKRYESG